MQFNSFAFLLGLLPIALVGHHCFRRLGQDRNRLIWLTACSLAYYAAVGRAGLPILVATTAFNYLAGKWLARDQSPVAFVSRKQLLTVAIIVNVALLSFFKYTNFFPFPLGLSFMTLQQIMYLVDCYEHMNPANSPLEHALFVTFFPVVSMGPITRAGRMIPQFRAPVSGPLTEQDYGHIARGLMLVAIGLFKKLVLAGALGVFVDQVIEHPGEASCLQIWMMATAYYLQIYFDFSGYSDMAIGIGRMFGWTIPINFNSPFFAKNIIVFWRRWHMTLSEFITSHMYTPLVRAAKKVTLARAMATTVFVMVMVGIWHGAAWTFVIFGALHGLALVVNQLWKKTKVKIPGPIAWLLTLLFLDVSFVFFRSRTVNEAWGLVKRMFNPDVLVGNFSAFMGESRADGFEMLFWMAVAVVVVAWPRNSQQQVDALRPSPALALRFALMMAVSFIYLNSVFSRGFVYVLF